MVGALDSAASRYADATRTLEKALAQARSQWGDSARRAFDSQHIDPLLAHATRSATELAQLAQEFNSAARLLADSVA